MTEATLNPSRAIPIAKIDYELNTPHRITVTARS